MGGGGKETKRGKRRKEVGDYRLWRRLVYGSADAHHLFERTCSSKCVYPPPPSLVASQLKIATKERNPRRFPYYLRLCFYFTRSVTARVKYKYVFERVVVRDEIRFSERIETRAPIIILLFRNPRGEALRVPIETVSRLLRGRSDRGIIEGDE